MDYELKYKYERDFLHAKVSGTESLSTSLSYWIDIIEEARLRNFKNILIEERLNGVLAKSDSFRLNQELSKTNLTHIKKIAFVDHHPDHSETNSFSISMALKYGLNIMLFNSLAEAKIWLK